MSKRVLKTITIILIVAVAMSLFIACENIGEKPAQYTQGLQYELIEGRAEYRLIGIGEATQQEIIIPQEYNGMPVSEIGVGAFSSQNEGTNNKIKSVVIPYTVTAIEKQAFYECADLQTAVLPSHLTYIGENAFWGCEKLESINIQSKVTTIGKGAFFNCKSLLTINIPKSVVYIGERALGGTDNLTAITVHENNPVYKAIDGNLYTKNEKILLQYAYGQTDDIFKIPSQVQTIGAYAFINCKTLMHLETQDNLTAINANAFYGCDNLESIILSKNIEKIAGGAFFNCGKLSKVYFRGQSQNWSNIDFAWGNAAITNGKIYYYSLIKPDQVGDFWFYKNGTPTVWVD